MVTLTRLLNRREITAIDELMTKKPLAGSRFLDQEVRPPKTQIIGSSCQMTGGVEKKQASSRERAPPSNVNAVGPRFFPLVVLA